MPGVGISLYHLWPLNNINWFTLPVSLRYTSRLRQNPSSSPTIFIFLAETGSKSKWNSVLIPLIRENTWVE